MVLLLNAKHLAAFGVSEARGTFSAGEWGKRHGAICHNYANYNKHVVNVKMNGLDRSVRMPVLREKEWKKSLTNMSNMWHGRKWTSCKMFGLYPSAAIGHVASEDTSGYKFSCSMTWAETQNSGEEGRNSHRLANFELIHLQLALVLPQTLLASAPLKTSLKLQMNSANGLLATDDRHLIDKFNTGQGLPSTLPQPASYKLQHWETKAGLCLYPAPTAN